MFWPQVENRNEPFVASKRLLHSVSGATRTLWVANLLSAGFRARRIRIEAARAQLIVELAPSLHHHAIVALAVCIPEEAACFEQMETAIFSAPAVLLATVFRGKMMRAKL